MSAIRVTALSVDLGHRPVLSGIDFEARPGEVVGLIGPNGAGKSTLLRAILGLVDRRAGKITIGGTALESLKPSELAKRIAYLPQSPAIHWPVTVERLVALGRLPHLDAWHRPGADDAAAIGRALEATDTAGLARRNVLTLSGGERARVLLARALAVEAPNLLVDEPVSALDPYHQFQVMDYLKAYARKGQTIVVVLHDLSLASRYTDRLYLIDQGRIAASGPPGTVLSDDNLEAIYKVQVLRTEGPSGSAILPWRRVGPESS
ncbi:MAG: ABC transporter ATP-binding protein [Proteobacteria bacterium]|nr:ABC transporter ATP-binding protein [Pseudomonadota bacterium]